MADDYRVDEAGLEFIKQREGFIATAKQDITSPAIGYGMHMWKDKPVTKDYPGTVTRAEADVELRRQVDKTYAPVVARALKEKGVTVGQNKFNALASISFNTRPSVTQHLVDYMSKRQIDLPDFMLSATTKGQPNVGVQRRRRHEWALFTTPDSPASQPVGVNAKAEPAKVLPRFTTTAAAQTVDETKRVDGTTKGDGFLGVLQRPDGKVSTELSIGVQIDGKETQIPTLVPTLTTAEVQTLLALPEGVQPPPAIAQKAVDFAKQRIAEGKPVFAQAGEQPQPLGPEPPAAPNSTPVSLRPTTAPPVAAPAPPAPVAAPQLTPILAERLAAMLPQQAPPVPQQPLGPAAAPEPNATPVTLPPPMVAQGDFTGPATVTEPPAPVATTAAAPPPAPAKEDAWFSQFPAAEGGPAASVNSKEDTWFQQFPEEAKPPAPKKGFGTKALELLKHIGTHPTSSVVPAEGRAAVASGILGHDVPPISPDAPSVGEMFNSAKQSSAAELAAGTAKGVGNFAFGLTAIPQLYELMKTGVAAGPDIARGLVNNPVETARGFTAGTTEGALEQLNPVNIALTLMGLRKSGLLKGRPPGPPGAPPAGPLLSRTNTGASGPLMNIPQTPGQMAAAAPVAAQPTGPLMSRTGTGTPPALMSIPQAPGTMSAAARVAPAAPPTTGTGTPGALIHIPQSLGKMAATVKVVDKVVETQTKAGTAPEIVADNLGARVVQSVDEVMKDMRRYFGAQLTADKVYPNLSRAEGKAAVQRQAPGPGRVPLRVELAELDRGFADKLLDPKGAVTRTGLTVAGGAVAGAAVGGALDEDDHLRGVLLGGIVGGSIPLILTHIMTSSSKSKAVGDLYFGSMLSHPRSVLHAYAGGFGGTSLRAAVDILGGDPRGARLVKELFKTKFTEGIVDSLRNPASALGHGYSQQATGIGRIYDAMNEPFLRAMTRAGYTLEEAKQVTLSGTPRTALGQTIARVWQQYFILKVLGSAFPRVGVHALEFGFEGNPLTGLIPPKYLSKGLQGLNSGTPRMRAARVGVGTGIMAGLYAEGDKIPDWLKPSIGALFGTYGTPARAALLSNMAWERGQDAWGQASAALGGLGEQVPMAQYGPTEAMRQFASGAPLIPNVVAGVARAMDPNERNAGGPGWRSWFGRTVAKIPVAREKLLPVRGSPVNIAGEKNDPRTSAIERFWGTGSTQGKKLQDVPANIVSELKRLPDVNVNAPAFEQKIEIGGRKIAVPPDLAVKWQHDRREYLLPHLQAAINSPAYRSADDAKKTRILNSVIQHADAAGSAKSRGQLISTLSKQGKLK